MDLLHLDQDEETVKRPSINTNGAMPHSMGTYQPYEYQPVQKPLNTPVTRFTSSSSELQKIISFLVIGGSASLINLLFVFLLDRYTPSLPFVVISIISTEISLLFNFYLNDRFTFRSLLAASNRTWLQRCLRFHGPASIGFGLTLLIGNFAKHGLHLPSVISQAIAIAIVTIVNFVMHRYWTFRPTHQPA